MSLLPLLLMVLSLAAAAPVAQDPDVNYEYEEYDTKEEEVAQTPAAAPTPSVEQLAALLSTFNNGQAGFGNLNSGTATGTGVGQAAPGTLNPAGIGNNNNNSGGATGTGVGQAQVAPGGFGAAIGVGTAITTPFGNFAFGQGQGVAAGGKK